MRCAWIVAAALFLGGCATGPVEETKAFVTAVAAVKASADTILDDFNVAERKQFAILKKRSGRLGFRSADEAYYYSTIAEAPATRQFRRAIVIIHDYAELLRILVDGTNVQNVRAQVNLLAANLSTLLAAPQIKVATAGMSELIDRLAAAASIAEARRLAAQGAPAVRELLASLRDAAPAILEEFILDLQATRSIARPEFDKRLQERRLAVANYVVLLDRLEETFTRLLHAFERPSNPVTLAALIQASADLHADVQAARKALAAIRGS
jgi:hypothetical protein